MPLHLNVAFIYGLNRFSTQQLAYCNGASVMVFWRWLVLRLSKTLHKLCYTPRASSKFVSDVMDDFVQTHYERTMLNICTVWWLLKVQEDLHQAASPTPSTSSEKAICSENRVGNHHMALKSSIIGNYQYTCNIIVKHICITF